MFMCVTFMEGLSSVNALGQSVSFPAKEKSLGEGSLCFLGFLCIFFLLNIKRGKKREPGKGTTGCSCYNVSDTGTNSSQGRATT